MNENKTYHEKAMELAEEAFFLERDGKIYNSYDKYFKAFMFEKRAALLLKDDYEKEPSRSILFKSAAYLALKNNYYFVAIELIVEALTGNPPKEIKYELKELFNSIDINLIISNLKKIAKNQELVYINPRITSEYIARDKID
jgi:hypothetical protein